MSTVEDAKKNLSDQAQAVVQKLRDQELLLSTAGVVLKEEERNSLAPEPVTNAEAPVPSSVVRDYQDALENLDRARKEFKNDQFNLMPENPLYKLDQKRVVDFEADLRKIEERYPQITSLALAAPPPSGQASGSSADTASPTLRVEQIERGISTLKSQLDEIKSDQTRLESKESKIRELQQKMDWESVYLKDLLAKQEQAINNDNQEFTGGIRDDESPTPAVLKRSKAAKKMMVGALAGGVFGGLALAFFIEMVLDRSVKRPSEIETKLRLPLFISIPNLNGNGHARVSAAATGNKLLLNETNSTELVPTNGAAAGQGAAGIAPWDPRHGLHRFYAGLRDRVIVNFEVRNLNHNPKLVGVTSCKKGAGVSSVASGLAASLSETGDGNVLLVDMRADEGASRQFHKGKPASGMDAAPGAESKDGASLQDNLYAASGADAEGQLPTSLSKRFASLMPKLKASDYDYIVFDLPPVSQTSMTARLSGLMDMVLLVIESEKTNRESVKRATALLHESKAHVSTVLNKVHTYVPTRLHPEFLDDEV